MSTLATIAAHTLALAGGGLLGLIIGLLALRHANLDEPPLPHNRRRERR